MINTLLGTKVGMQSAYDARGRRVGATVVKIDSNFVTQLKSTDSKDGYNAVQLGTGTIKSAHKPQIGHAKKAGLDMKIRNFREVRDADAQGLELGQEIKVGQVFFVGDSLKITGISKGKGFQGGVRRHGFHGGPKTHGQSDRHRAPGSIGSGTTPGRVYAGKKMAGHMGMDTVSYKNLEVVGVDKAANLLVIKGGVPGPVGGFVIIEKLGRIKGYTPPPEEKEDEEEGEESKGSNESEESKVEEVSAEAQEVVEAQAVPEESNPSTDAQDQGESEAKE